MSKHWKIRPLLWAAMIFALIGALLGGSLAGKAVKSLGENTVSMVSFERQWSNAYVQDIKASNALKYYIATGDKDSYEVFISINGFRAEALLSAKEIAPELKDNNILNLTYENSIAMNDIELAAISMAKNGNAKAAYSLLHGARYAQLGTAKSSLRERARGELVSALQSNVDQANKLLILGLLGLISSLGVAAYCWYRVGKLFQNQAEELGIARDALVLHANSLEERIEIRTRDLEAAKKAAETADHSKSAFLAQMSHEIRTPMNGVLGMTAALARTNLDERQMRLLNVIQESGDTLLALLNDVLDLAKIEAGRMEIENIDFNVGDIVRSAEAIFSTRAHDKGLSFAVTVDENSETWCKSDPTRLRQILYNLMSNAIKFTNEGNINIDVKGRKLDDDNMEFEFAVSDSGIGMNEEAISRLFQRFSQADSATTRKYGGTGLGLAICKQLANLMGGDISATSIEGKGSVFTLSLIAPLGEAPAKTDAEAFEKGFEDDGEAVSDLRILAAEDNANNRLVLKMFLEQVGATPVFVENGRLAVEAWKSQEFDVILMDVQMPVLSGPEATEEIRKFEKETGRKRTPIIALTANAMTHHVRECMLAGMDLHVAKPIRPDLLFAAIDKVISEPEFEIFNDISVA